MSNSSKGMQQMSDIFQV